MCLWLTLPEAPRQKLSLFQSPTPCYCLVTLVGYVGSKTMRIYRLLLVLTLGSTMMLGTVGCACRPAVSQSGVKVEKQATTQPTPAFTIAIQPLGKVPASRLEITRKAITQYFSAKATILPGRSLPKEAYYTPRQRYRADTLLNYLGRGTAQEYTKVIGITEVDISTTKGEYKDWGIFGLGDMPGRACVVSSYRLGRKGDATRFRQRLSNTVVHEVGHTLGLNHCPTKGCVMQDAQGSISVFDNESGSFCRSCQDRIKTYLR